MASTEETQYTLDGWVDNSTLSMEATPAPLTPFDFKEYRIALQLYPIYTFVLVPIGIISNILAFVVLSTRAMSTTSSSVYFRALAVTDSINLAIFLAIMVVRKYQSHVRSLWYCKTSFFAYSSFTCLSSWLVTLMTLERFVVVMFPLQTAAWFSRRRALIVVIVATVISLAIGLYTFWLVNINDVSGLCGYKLSTHYHVVAGYQMFEIVFGSYIPIVGVFLLNCMIVVQLCRAQRLKKSMTKERAVEKRADDTTKKRGNDAEKVAPMLLSISVSFFFFNAPYASFVASMPYWVDRGRPGQYASGALVQQVTMMLMLLNYTTNFFFYSLTGTRFRREFLQLFCGKRKSRDGPATGNATSMYTLNSRTENTSLGATQAASSGDVRLQEKNSMSRF